MSFEQPNPLKTIGGRLRVVRMVRGMTADEIADALKVSRPTVTTWELDRVSEIDDHKIEAFAKLTKVAAQWLRHGGKTDLEIPPRILQRAATGRGFSGMRSKEAMAPPQPPAPEPSNVAEVPAGAIISEIKPALTAHAKSLDIMPQAKWAIPREVLTLSFNCEPESAVITRTRLPFTLPDGTQVSRLDYLLLDASRQTIDEPGLYYVADPQGKEAKRAVAQEVDGKLRVHFYGETDEIEPESLEVLGRAMAVFHGI